jgi:hypothetical protein
VKRLAPQPVVSTRPLAKESPSRRHQGPQDAGMCGPDAVLYHLTGWNKPEHVSTSSQAERNAVLSPVRSLRARGISGEPVAAASLLSATTANSSPYFSSSLTLSIRGAVSPARHVLTRPRPHPVSRWEQETTPEPIQARTALETM